MQVRVGLGRLFFEWGPRLNRRGTLYHPLVRPMVGLCAAWVRRVLAGQDSLVRVNGVVLAVGPAPCYAGLEFRFRDYEPGVARTLRRLLQPGMTVVDVGAHVGYHSLLAARLVGNSGAVYAFEPHPITHSLLQTNARLNGLTNIIAVAEAADDSCGEKDLFLGSVHEGHSTLYAPSLVGSRRIQVHTITLDAYFERQRVSRLDLIKIDVQGGEAAVLRGAGGILRRFPSLHLIMEIDPVFLRAADSNPRAIVHLLLDAGFIVRRIDCTGALHAVETEMLAPSMNGLYHLLASRPDADH